MGNFFNSIFGGGERPSAEPVEKLEEDRRRTQRARNQALSNQNGVGGGELGSGQVQSGTNTTFGN